MNRPRPEAGPGRTSLEFVAQRELHAAPRLRVAGRECAVVAAEAGEVRRVRQLRDVELRRVGRVEDVPAEAQPVIRDADLERLAQAEIDVEVPVAAEQV